MEQTNALIVKPQEVSASEYRPYKIWSIAEKDSLRVVLVKRVDALCIAACPSLGIRVDNEDYLEASFELSRQIKERLKVPQDTAITSTCSIQFSLVDGSPISLEEDENTQSLVDVEKEDNGALLSTSGSEQHALQDTDEAYSPNLPEAVPASEPQNTINMSFDF